VQGSDGVGLPPWLSVEGQGATTKRTARNGGQNLPPGGGGRSDRGVKPRKFDGTFESTSVSKQGNRSCRKVGRLTIFVITREKIFGRSGADRKSSRLLRTGFLEGRGADTLPYLGDLRGARLQTFSFASKNYWCFIDGRGRVHALLAV